MMAGLMGAIGGAGKAVEDVADASIASRLKIDFERQMTEILRTRKEAETDLAQRLQVSGANQQIRVGQAGIDAKRADETAQAEKVEGVRRGLIDAHTGGMSRDLYGADAPPNTDLSDEERRAFAPNTEQMANIDLRAAREAGISDSGPVNQLNTIESAKQRATANEALAEQKKIDAAERERHNRQNEGLLGMRIEGAKKDNTDKIIKDAMSLIKYDFKDEDGKEDTVKHSIALGLANQAAMQGAKAGEIAANISKVMPRADQLLAQADPEQIKGKSRAELYEIATSMALKEMVAQRDAAKGASAASEINVATKKPAAALNKNGNNPPAQPPKVKRPQVTAESLEAAADDPANWKPRGLSDESRSKQERARQLFSEQIDSMSKRDASTFMKQYGPLLDADQIRQLNRKISGG